MFDPLDPCHYLCPGYRLSTGGLREVLDPGLLTPVGLWAETTADEVEAALEALAEAQRGWRALDAKTRAGHLHRLAARIEAADAGGGAGGARVLVLARRGRALGALHEAGSLGRGCGALGAGGGRGRHQARTTGSVAAAWVPGRRTRRGAARRRMESLRVTA